MRKLVSRKAYYQNTFLAWKAIARVFIWIETLVIFLPFLLNLAFDIDIAVKVAVVVVHFQLYLTPPLIALTLFVSVTWPTWWLWLGVFQTTNRCTLKAFTKVSPALTSSYQLADYLEGQTCREWQWPLLPTEGYWLRLSLFSNAFATLSAFSKALFTHTIVSRQPSM